MFVFVLMSLMACVQATCEEGHGFTVYVADPDENNVCADELTVSGPEGDITGDCTDCANGCEVRGLTEGEEYTISATLGETTLDETVTLGTAFEGGCVLDDVTFAF